MPEFVTEDLEYEGEVEDQQIPEYDHPMPMNAPPEVLSMREQVYQFIAAHGEVGVTDEEIEHGLGMPGNTSRARRIELYKAGAVRRKRGGKRRTLSGRKAAIWVATQYFVKLFNDVPKNERDAEVQEYRLQINRKVAKLPMDELEMLSVLSECGSADGSSILSELAALGIEPASEDHFKASILMLAVVQWAEERFAGYKAALEKAENQRDELWALLHDIDANLPDLVKRDNVRFRQIAQQIAERRFDVLDPMPKARLEAAVARLAAEPDDEKPEQQEHD